MALLEADELTACPPIYLEASLFETTKLTGITRYTARLAMAIGARAPLRFFVGGEVFQLPRGFDWSQDQDPGRWVRRVWRSPRVPMGRPPEGSVGIYCAIRPLEKRFPREISVLHDFTPLLLPEAHLQQTKTAFGHYFCNCLPQSDLALADSYSTKADAAWLTPMDPSKVVVAYPGPSMCVGRHLHRRKVERRADVGLVVSTVEPRKNARFLIDWFRTSAVLPPKMELWWVGGRGWLTSKKAIQELEQAGSGRSIKFLGYVSDKALCKLYQQAGWSIYPSLYEGFGLPVLDALRHGTPVLTSGNSSLREFAGPGVHLFDPCDLASLDRAWQQLQSSTDAEIPLAKLDRQYNWDRIAWMVIDFARGRSLPPTSTYAGPHRVLARTGVDRSH